MKSEKIPYIIYTYTECLIKNTDGCANNPENFSTTNLMSIFLVDIQ